MKDYKTIRAEINGFYNKKKNLNEIKRLEESLKEVENYLNDHEISDDVLLELHKNFKHDIPSLNLTMISFFASFFSGLYGLLMKKLQKRNMTTGVIVTLNLILLVSGIKLVCRRS